jgi:dinuclear metal center YbgI/SA1388 family protein
VVNGLYRRLAALVRAGVALYSCHLPLDAHETVGNNMQLCRLLGLQPQLSWASDEGNPVGIVAAADTDIHSLRRLLDDRLDTSARLIAGGSERVARVAILTGSGADRAAEAAAIECDTLITGEGAHHTYFAAEEAGINVLLAGHYATETLGVRALMGYVRLQLGLRCLFVDHPTGL